MKRLLTATTLVLLLAHMPLSAKETTDLRPIIDEQRALADTLSNNSKTLGLSPEQIDSIRRAQMDVFDAAGNHTQLSDLEDRDQMRLKNALATISAAMQNTRNAAEERDVCWREKKMGSNITVTRCATQEEMRRVREGARDWKEKPGVCGEGNPGCSSR